MQIEPGEGKKQNGKSSTGQQKVNLATLGGVIRWCIFNIPEFLQLMDAFMIGHDTLDTRQRHQSFPGNL